MNPENTEELTSNTPLSDLPIFGTETPTATNFDARRAVADVMRRRSAASRTMAAPTPASTAPATSQAPGADADFWHEVDLVAGACSAQMANDTTMANLSDEEAHRQGMVYIDRQVREQRREMTAEGHRRWSDDYEARLRAAVESKLFGLGRLQQLVDNDDVENIMIMGYDNVTLLMADGRRVTSTPVASSDEDLIRDLSFLAARRSNSERSFNPATPFLSLSLPGGHRLQATAWVTPRPVVTIRRHRLVDIGLDDLVDLDELSQPLCDFLRAAVQDHRSIVVSGAGQGSGKTTLVRALANAMDPDEIVVTIETEYELFLHQMPDHHHMVIPFEARPGSGEIGADGRSAGEITIDDLIFQSLRFNAARVVVGEVRGKEVTGMFKAMQMGHGSFSTIHANSANDVIERLVTCAVEEMGTSETHAYRQVGQHIDLIVYLDNFVDEDGRKHRYVAEVIEVGLGEGDRKVAVTNVFVPGSDGHAVPATPPSFMDNLVDLGIPRSMFAASHVAGRGGR